jgi:hypothetical protein
MARVKLSTGKDVVLTVLTIVICIAWLTAFVLRLFRPVEVGPVLDTSMLAIISYWFGAKALGHKGDGGEAAPT